jgi:peptidoglycan hydrolase-like protein with peptidoglycan-binding domain
MKFVSATIVSALVIHRCVQKSRSARRKRQLARASGCKIVPPGLVVVVKHPDPEYNQDGAFWPFNPYNYYWCVVQLQHSLSIARSLSGSVASPGYADGYFGGATLTSVKSFQRAASLYPDGVAGPQSWKWLCFWLQQVHASGQMYNDGCNLDGIY